MPQLVANVYSDTLQTIIDAKLHELVKKRDTFEKAKSEVLRSFNLEPDQIEQLHILLEGTKRCFQLESNLQATSTPNAHRLDMFNMLKNLEKLLEQLRRDRSVSVTLLDDWKANLLQMLDAQSSRYEYASLYARLVTDWLALEKGIKPRKIKGDSDEDEDNDDEMSDSFAELDNSAKIESRQAWEASVFDPYNTNVEDIKAFLQLLFGEDDASKQPMAKAVAQLRNKVTEFERSLGKYAQFDVSVVRWAIHGVLNSERLSEEKRKALRDFQHNTVFVMELTDVLNLRMANIDQWNWGATVPVEQRRRVAGYYSIHMDEDLLQAIFLQFIGTKWSVFFRHAFAALVDNEEMWITSQDAVPATEHQLRQYYIGQCGTKQSLQKELHRHWRSTYFLTQLPKSERQIIVSSDGDEEADYTIGQKRSRRTKQMARKAAVQSPGAARRRVEIQEDLEESSDEDMGFGLADEYNEPQREDYGDHNDEPRNFMELKQGLLHLLQTEILMSRRLHGEITAIRGQFENWNALLPHSTCLAVLEFFGVSHKWLKFMKTFLQAPLGFEHGGDVEQPRLRKRGVPGSHPMSDMFGETVLFCMDTLINQECNGARLWRLHDDFWFWSSSSEVCKKAWVSIGKFSRLFGLVLDDDKAGSGQVSRLGPPKRPSDLGLPSNPIRWGFLYLNSETGGFEIDQDLVDKHIVELKKQLDEKQSKGLFSWIQAWNTYAINFFATNFGKPAYCFGADHIKKILLTLERMQSKIFNESNAVKFITGILGRQYDTHEVPDGYIFFPTSLGGLNLRNPFITPLQFNKPLVDGDPETRLDKWEKDERQSYESAKKTFDKRIAQGTLSTSGMSPQRNYHPPPGAENTFLSFEDYIKYREVYDYELIPGHNRLGAIFKSLLQVPTEQRIELSAQMTHAAGRIDTSGAGAHDAIQPYPYNMNPYWLWVCQFYGPEIVKKFGGLNIVDGGVLPIGMVGLLKGDSVTWT